MEARNNLGIWMDHSKAYLMEVNLKKNNRSIESDFSLSTKEEALSRSEDIMHNKEQQMHQAYYSEIGKEILKYKHVLLFGPTRAKAELHNYLSKDLHFKDIKIDIEPADKMTINEQHAFVNNHFENK
jgi:hypothetical protein